MKLDSSIAAVVTGAASGLGEATARALAGRGVKVALFDRDSDKGEKVADEIGGTFCQVDVTSDEAVDAGFARAREAHGHEARKRRRFEEAAVGGLNAFQHSQRVLSQKRSHPAQRQKPADPIQTG